jgi:hypothetical protein
MPNANVVPINVVDPNMMFAVQADFPTTSNGTFQSESAGATSVRGMTSKKGSKRAMMVLKEFQQFDHTSSSVKADKQSSSNHFQTGITDNNGFSDDSSDSDRHADTNRDVNKTLPRLISGMSMHSAAETVAAFEGEYDDVHEGDFSHHNQNKYDIDDIIDQPNGQFDDYYPVKPGTTFSNTSHPNVNAVEGNPCP